MNNKLIMSRLVVTFIFLLVIGNVGAQKTQTVVFQTSAQCGMCKDRIEGAMNFVPGVKYAELNMKDMSLSIKYNTKKISAGELKKGWQPLVTQQMM